MARQINVHRKTTTVVYIPKRELAKTALYDKNKKKAVKAYKEHKKIGKKK